MVGGASALNNNQRLNIQTKSSVMTSPTTVRGLLKNANLYWRLATGLAVWFLCFHTPVFWRQRRISRDTMLAVHIVTAAMVYLACVHNCLLTPSLHAVTKWMHRWMGRIGLLSGLVSFSLGAFLAWSRLNRVGEGSTSLGFAIPITIGGILQLQCEYKGYRAIRKYKALQTEIDALRQAKMAGKMDRHRLQQLLVDQRVALGNHISWLLNLFVMACGIPAGIRLAEVFVPGDEGIQGILALLGVIGALQFLAGRYIRKYVSSTVGGALYT